MSPRAFPLENRISMPAAKNAHLVGPVHRWLSGPILAGWVILVACGRPAWPGGIHALLAWSPRGVRVVEVPPDGPAQAAGLEPGDRLIAIDGLPVEDQSLEEVQRRLAGEVGSFVELVVVRGTRSLELRVERVPYRKGSRR